MKIVFWGSDDFARYHLDRLKDENVSIVACVTQPDKSRGRKMIVRPTPIKEFAIENRLPCFQPERLTDKGFIRELQSLEAELFVVIAYGKILPKEILSIPKRYSLNVHASLLPKYRGAAPINWAIINGDAQTGVTIIRLNEKMDAGEIIAQEIVPIADDETSVVLRSRLMEVGAQCLLKTLKDIEHGSVRFTSQLNSDVTIAPKLTKALGLIDWKKSAKEIRNLVRGLQPWPGAYVNYREIILKVLSVDELATDCEGVLPGTVVKIDERGLHVAAGNGAVVIRKVLPESGKPMDIHAFLRGHEVAVGERMNKK